jgi:hypothetical protein
MAPSRFAADFRIYSQQGAQTGSGATLNFTLDFAHHQFIDSINDMAWTSRRKAAG